MKSHIFRTLNPPAVMTQIMHFTDFSLPPKTFKKWFANGGNPPGFRHWLREVLDGREREFKLFVDSGGFKLLYNQDFDLEAFDFSADPDSIFELQTKFGADIVASLDYPIHPGMQKSEVQERMEKTIENALRLLAQVVRVQEQGDQAPFPYLVVYGHSYRQARDFTAKLVARIEGVSNKIPFGIAIGSLVPLKNDYRRISSILHGVKGALTDFEQEHDQTIPIHVFGISGYLIPHLTLLGADSFDSTTFVRAAMNLRYIVRENWRGMDFKKIDTLACECEYCQLMEDHGLNVLRKILSDRPKRIHHLQDADVTKSYVYALIALHNLQEYLDEVGEIREALGRGEPQVLFERIKALAENNVRGRPLLEHMALWDQTLAEPLGIRLGDQLKLTKEKLEDLSRFERFSLSYKPWHFDIDQREYTPPSREVLLILPCTRTKPYGESRTHRRILGYLEDENINLGRLHKVTLSGMYGPVPEELEREDPVLYYDYVLSTAARKRIDLLTDRLVSYLDRWGGMYENRVAYVTAKAYRKVTERVARQSSHPVLVLPDNHFTFRSSDLLRRKQLDTLATTLQELLENSATTESEDATPRQVQAKRAA